MPTRAYDTWKTLLHNAALPCGLIDLDALDANVQTLLSACQEGVGLRIATKSIRNTELLRRIFAAGQGRIRGLMPWSAHEVQKLAEDGFDDFLMGYPCTRPDEAAALARVAASGKRVIATFDAPAHLALLNQAATAANTTLCVCIDLDMSWRPLGGFLHLGVRRSSIRSIKALKAALGVVKKCKNLNLCAVLGYEAQIAGMQDHNPTSHRLDPIRCWIKRRSRPGVLGFRARALALLAEEGFEIKVVNGGGSGSVGWTSADPSITEVSIGSGCLAPTLFDGYAGLSLKPAVFFAIPVCRVPERGVVTCLGGGFIASGAVGADRWPVVFAPKGLEALPMEGWGEVQTPLKVPPAWRSLQVGDPIICRPAKSGEIAERLSTYALIRGDQIEGWAPTYRGLGWCFG